MNIVGKYCIDAWSATDLIEDPEKITVKPSDVVAEFTLQIYLVEQARPLQFIWQLNSYQKR